MISPGEDIALLRAIISGNELAIRIIYERYSNRVYKLSLVLLKDTGWSEDVVQEVFIKFWNNRQALDPDGNVWNLLYVITKRTALNKLRDIGKSNSNFEKIWSNISYLSDSVHEEFIAKELSDRLAVFLDRLPDRQREIFKLSREQGYTHQQIALQLGISPNTVKNHIVQALRVIRKYTQEPESFFFLIFFCSAVLGL